MRKMLMMGNPGKIGLRLAVAGAFAAGCLFVPMKLFAQGVQAVTVPLNNPAGVCYDAVGNFYVADQNNQVIRKVNTAGIMTTYAGSGDQGFEGDGGQATAASLNQPQGVAIDINGNLYISDTSNNRIRKVTTAGIITTIGGTGVAGFSGDGASATSATISRPTAIAVDGSGNVFFADSNNNRIREIFASNGFIQTVAGNGTQGYEGDGGPALNASLDTPQGVAVDAAGNLYLGDTNNHRVREVIASSGIIITIAGTGTVDFSGDGSTGTGAGLASPRGVAVTSSGVVYIADSNNQRIRALTSGSISTVAGSGDQGADSSNGAANSVSLDTPRAVAVGPLGSFAIADTSDGLVRSVSSGGNVVTTAGIGDSVPNALAIAVSSQNFIYGQGSLTATMTSATPGVGNIIFYDFGAPLASVPLVNNSAAISLSTLRVGQHSLSASFAGDSANAPVVSSVTLVAVAPASVTIAATSASIVYGQALPTITGTVSGVLAQDSGNVTATFSATATSTSAPGTYPISAVLGGSAAGNYTLTSITGSITIGKANSLSIITSSLTSILLGSPITLTTAVASSTSGTPTGTVTFFDEATVLAGPIAVAGGRAATTVTLLGAGSHNLRAVYNGDANFNASTSPTIVQQVSDFNFTLTATGGGTGAQTVIPGQTAVFNYSVAPVNGAFSYPIALSATGLPPGATVTFSPSTITPGSASTNFTLSIQTKALTATVKGIGATTFAALVLLPFAGSIRRRARKLNPLTMVVVFVLTLAAVGGITGCGSGTGYFGQSQQSYTINVIGTASGPGGTTLQHTATVQLTVQ